MPIPALNAIGFSGFEDTQFYVKTPVDGSIVKEMQGGFTVTRPQYTRPPPIMFTIGYTDLTDANYAYLLAFFQTYQNNMPWTYVDVLNNQSYQVRFDNDTSGWTSAYKGIGSAKLWEISNVVLRSI